MKKKKQLTRSNRPIKKEDYREPKKKNKYIKENINVSDEIEPKKKSPLKLARHKKKKRRLKKWVYIILILIIFLMIGLFYLI